MSEDGANAPQGEDQSKMKLVAKAAIREGKETGVGAGKSLVELPGEIASWCVRHKKFVGVSAVATAATVALSVAGVIPVGEIVHALKGTKESAMYALTNHGYEGVAGGVGLESMFLPIPGETILVTVSGVAAKTHTLSLPLIIGSAALGGFIGDSAGWFIGRHAGSWMERKVFKSAEAHERLKVVNFMFRKYGGKVVFMGRWMTGVREFAALSAGIGKMPYRKFAPYNAAGALAWGSMYGSAGYYGAQFMESSTGKVVVPSVGVVVALGGLGVMRHWWKKTKLEMEQEEAAKPGKRKLPSIRKGPQKGPLQ